MIIPANIAAAANAAKRVYSPTSNHMANTISPIENNFNTVSAGKYDVINDGKNPIQSLGLAKDDIEA